MDEGVPGTASTAQTSGANFGGGLNIVNDDEGDDTPVGSTVITSGAGFGNHEGSFLQSEAGQEDSSDSDIVVAFVPDIESDDSNEIQ